MKNIFKGQKPSKLLIAQPSLKLRLMRDLPRALADTQNAMDYYDGKSIGLGNKFKDALDKTLKHISINPFYQFIYKDYRGLMIKEFPLYQVIFYINECKKLAHVDAVFLVKQDPEKKPK